MKAGLKKYKTPFIKPEFPEEKQFFRDYIQIQNNNWFTNFGPFERRFRKDVSAYMGAGNIALTTSSATTGLLLAIKAYMPRPDTTRNQIIMPSFTFVAGAEALKLLGYEPVFVDINMSDLQPNATRAHKYLIKNYEKVCGILFCNIFGVGAPNIIQWEELAKDFNLPLVIDSAAGFGSLYADNSKVGTKGDCEVFSLHATKPFAVGEGGVVVARDKTRVDKMIRESNFGFDKSGEAISLGINAKLSEIAAAIGIRQLKVLDSRLKKRRETLSIYKHYLKPFEFIFQSNDEHSSVPFISCLVPTTLDIDAMIRLLRAESIESRRYYNPPLHQHRLLKDCKKIDKLDVTEKVCKRIISLPSHAAAVEIIPKVEKIVRTLIQ